MPKHLPRPVLRPPVPAVRGRRRLGLVTVVAAAVLAVVGSGAAEASTPTVTTGLRSPAAALPVGLPGTTGVLRLSTTLSPSTTVVRDDRGVVATFTAGARTVTLRGPLRTFAEPSTTSATVSTTTWVRLLAEPSTGVPDWAWLAAALVDASPDVLATATQYTTGAPERTDVTGARLAGDASYGPYVGTTRMAGADFNDYLGVAWTYPTSVDRPEADQLGALDCSGYVRMVLGRRGGVPLALAPDGRGLPRRSFEILASGPGVQTQANTGRRPALPASLAAGDLVFFDASADDGTQVDHVGIYLGADSTGAPRFLSSRVRADGPTMGDIGGRSTLSGTGLYASSFRAVRRV